MVRSLRLSSVGLALLFGLLFAASAAHAGRDDSPASHSDAVARYDSDVYKIRFNGGEVARVIVSGDGDTDLDLYVYDALGNVIASDTDASDQNVLIWFPRYDANYTIVVRNLGSVYNRYEIVTN